MNTNPKAIRILCYGDSNTWGYIPNSGRERFDSNIRRTGQLQSLLGNNYEIIEEGLNSRTLTSDDPRPGKEGRSGRDYLIPCLESHDPLDRVILFLGTNELKDIFEKDVSNCIREYEEHFIRQIIDRPSQSKSKKVINYRTTENRSHETICSRKILSVKNQKREFLQKPKRS